jgi:prepilin-type N-terminal cleavage/methylation domain-containing protein
MTARRVLSLTAPLRRSNNDNGFTLIDVMLTIGIIGVVSSIAIVQVGEASLSIKGDGGMRVVAAQLNLARELAITQRRNMQVRFVGANQLDVVRQNVPAGTTLLSSVVFEGGVRYALVAGLPDTPDGFGNRQATDFGAAATLFFTSEGTFVDDAGNPVNGTIFLALPAGGRSARGITILGATGRVTAYRWDGSRWVRL